MRRSPGFRRAWLCAALLLNVEWTGGALASPVHASPGFGAGQVDPSLEGRLLQRSDGVFFIVHNGARYAMQLAPLSDDDINGIADGTGDLFGGALPSAASPTVSQPVQPPPAPPGGGGAAVQPLPQVQTVPLGNGVVLGVPQGYGVASTGQGNVLLDKNGITQISAEVQPPQPGIGAVITKAENDIAASTKLVLSWGDITEDPPQGNAASIAGVPFTGSTLSGPGFVTYHGGVIAIIRTDQTVVVVVVVTRGAGDESAAVETVLESVVS